jgi:hypothetical protein
MSRTLRAPTVELSIAATSEELAILSAAAQRKQMSLKDFLRLQLVSAAKAASKAAAAQAPRVSAPSPSDSRLVGLKPAFLP